VLPRSLLRFRKPLILLLHLVLIPLGYLAGFALRFDVPIPAHAMAIYVGTVPLLLAVRLLTFAAFRLYQGWWRYVGMQDVMDIGKAVSASTGLFIFILYLTGQAAGFPRSVLILDWAIAIFVFGGIRFAVRAFRERRAGWVGLERRGKAALVIGAGEAAERLLRQLRHGGADFRAVALVDDDPAKRGMRLHGVPVLGGTDDLPALIPQCGIELLIIAMPSASRDDMCWSPGGAGSIGSELARQVAGFGPARLILVEQAESNLYFTTWRSGGKPDLEVVPVVADICDERRMSAVFASHRPDYVFHAAAYKHVPMMEANVGEAVRNNVLGTLCVARPRREYGAKQVRADLDRQGGPPLERDGRDQADRRADRARLAGAARAPAPTSAPCASATCSAPTAA
jgi:FlaA1/EpsC-like NDP-sugar epimerase